MRFLTFIFSAIFAVSLTPDPAHANCDYGTFEAACKIKSGHYRIRKPDGAGPHPTVVYLYGSLGNSAQKLSDTGFIQAFVERGYAVIVPVALDLRYDTGIGSGWFLRHERGQRKRNEIKFVESVLGDAQVRHNIDRRKVMIVGMSRGGFLTWEIACHRPELAQAYAPIAAGYLGPMPRRCKRAVKLLHTHGRTDKIVPLNPKQPWVSAGAKAMDLGAAFNVIARTNGCTPPSRPKKFREYDRSSWSCPRGASLDLLVHNGGHTIPLSWYSTVVDWFAGGPATPNTGTATTAGTSSPRFKSVGAEQGSRFKRPGSGAKLGSGTSPNLESD
ncbi:MAG: hypothetical protein AAGB15_04955 [Pseudomonadota bacterium]